MEPHVITRPLFTQTPVTVLASVTQNYTTFMGTPCYPTLLAILVGVGEAALSGQPALGCVDVLELDVVEDDIVGVGTPLVQVVEVAEKDVVTK